MLFASLDFLLFFVPVLAAAWLLRDRPRAWLSLLLVASYFFYAASPRPGPGETTPPWGFVGLLVVSTLLDFLAGREIHAAEPGLRSALAPEVARARRIRGAWLGASMVGNLGLLAYFKYVDFLLEASADVLGVLLPGALGELGLSPGTLAPLLPIGISFYTFQSLSYTIDVWRGRLTPETSLLRFAVFVACFPQLVAGPIVRAREFLPQLHRRPRLRPDEVESGLFRILKGVLKKVVLGDFIAVAFTDLVFDAPDNYTSLENLLALYGFTLQIYADFSGYSDIAIGAARLLGLRLPENFDRPYQATDVGEFWRRWHMTLSTWLRDYLFFPLGGSRGSPAKTYFNLWLTMFLVGMWHGASWNFVIYSNLQAGAMLFNRWNRLRGRERSFKRAGIWLLGLPGLGLGMYGFGRAVLELSAASAGRLAVLVAAVFVVLVLAPLPGMGTGEPEARTTGKARASTKIWTVVHVALTFHFCALTRVFFRAEDLDHAKLMIARLLEFDGHGVRGGLAGVLALLVVGTAYHFTPRAWVDEHLQRWFGRLPGPVIGLLFAGAALIVLHLLDGPRANIYFAF